MLHRAKGSWPRIGTIWGGCRVTATLMVEIVSCVFSGTCHVFGGKKPKSCRQGATRH
jgi:hypothetical protein